MDYIQSTKNERVKNWKKLLTRKGRKNAKRYLIEGFHLIEEATKSNVSLSEVIVREDLLDQEIPFFTETTIVSVSKEVAKVISDTENSQGIYAVIEQEETESLKYVDQPFLFVDAIQDPGNLGTLVRSADAAGFQAMVLGDGTVDAYNPKTLRSAQGSHFHIDFYEGRIEEWISYFKDKNYPIYGTTLNESADSYIGKHYTHPFVLIVGNEGAGVRENLLSLTDANFYIPIKGKAESLNVTIAASILMFSLYQ